MGTAAGLAAAAAAGKIVILLLMSFEKRWGIFATANYT